MHDTWQQVPYSESNLFYILGIRPYGLSQFTRYDTSLAKSHNVKFVTYLQVSPSSHYSLNNHPDEVDSKAVFAYGLVNKALLVWINDSSKLIVLITQYGRRSFPTIHQSPEGIEMRQNIGTLRSYQYNSIIQCVEME